MVEEELLEREDMRSLLVVFYSCFQAIWDNEENPRPLHILNIDSGYLGVDRSQKERRALGGLGRDLPPSFSKTSLHGKNDGVQRVRLVMFDRGQNEVGVSIELRLWSESIVKSCK